jgi:hypothetical protein
MDQRREALSRTLLLARRLLKSHDDIDAFVDDALSRTTVALVAGPDAASSVAGQSTLTSLASLVLSMGCNLRLSVGETALAAPQPPVSGRMLAEGLSGLASTIIPQTRCYLGEPEPGDLVFVLGDAKPHRTVTHSWRLRFGDWWGGISDASGPSPSVTGPFRFGSALAAAVAASEAFKHALRMVVRERGVAPTVPELLECVTAAWVQLPRNDSLPRDIDLGDVDFISGGAITNAALHVLYRIDGLRMSARVFEPENLEPSNLNRYLLSTDSGLGRPKADILASHAPGLITVEPVRTAVTDATIRDFRPFASNVVIGTDNVPARWLLQREWPTLLIVGATAEFMTITSAHQFPGPCAGCLHPIDDNVNVTIPTISFVSYWAGLLTAARLIWARTSTPPYPPVLELWPLRLDLPDSQWWHPAQPDQRCPVHCPASAR